MSQPLFDLVEVTVEARATLPDALSEDAISSLVEHILGAEDASGAWTIGFQFVDDPTMQRMHRDFMGLDSPTDIMTFPYEPGEWIETEVVEDVAEAGGDIVISVDRAADQARDEGWDLTSELFFLVGHGVLHLLGWDDATDADRERMLLRQRELLASWPERTG